MLARLCHRRAVRAALRPATAGQRQLGTSSAAAAAGAALAELGIATSTKPRQLKRLSQDYYWYSPVLRAALDGKVADLVVSPASEAEVVATLRTCHALGVPVTPRGAGTGNYGQAVPLSGGVLLDLRGLVGFHTPTPGVVVAQAGQLMGKMEAALRPGGWELRFFPSTVAMATIGGFVAGGSCGVGSINYGVLRDPGSVIAVRLVTMEAEPRVLELTGDDVLSAVHAYGTNGIITEVTLPLAPAQDWLEAAATFPDTLSAAAAGLAIAESAAIVKRSVCTLGAPIPALPGFEGLGREIAHAGGSATAVAAAGGLNLMLLAPSSLDAAAALIEQHGGTMQCSYTAGEPYGAGGSRRKALYEWKWNHTTLRALRKDERITYLQCGYAADSGAGLLAIVQELEARYGGSAGRGRLDAEVMTHLEFVRMGGRVSAFGLPLVRWESKERLDALIEVHHELGAPVFNPHTFVLEDGGMKQTDQGQLELKRRHDPAGLLNPGKMRAWEGAAVTEGLLFAYDALREGHAGVASAAFAPLSAAMQEQLEADTTGDAEPAPAGGGGVEPEAASPGAAPPVEGFAEGAGGASMAQCRWAGGRSWVDLPTVGWAGVDRARAVALLPVAAVEQHGPHLPTGVDAMQCHGVVEAAHAELGRGPPVYTLPMQAVGTSQEHMAFPGTLSLTPDTLLAVIMDLGVSVRRAGVRKLVLVNGHGGNCDLLGLAARRLRVEQGMLVAVVHYFRDGAGQGVAEGLWPAAEARFGIHGGGIETSMMRHLQPQLVRMDKAEHFRSAAEARADKALFPHGAAVSFGWMAQDLNAAGVVGDAMDSDPERGRTVVERCGRLVAEVVREAVDADVGALLAEGVPYEL
jgi:creatinine amidohydrolase/Fe(II)-dependent formamide hydrolase-like protein/FAD/FMN-containing dehydrogenase